jgi:hypothetical protein
VSKINRNEFPMRDYNRVFRLPTVFPYEVWIQSNLTGMSIVPDEINVNARKRYYQESKAR